MSAAPDVIEKVGRSVLQHGKFSDRVYLMRLHPPDAPAVLEKMEALADANAYSKLFAKVPSSASEPFMERGYELEASVPGLFKGEEGLFLVRYPDPERRRGAEMDRILKVLELCRRACKTGGGAADSGQSRELGPGDADAIASVYKEVFETYPFPIHDAGYLRRTMEDGFRYFGMGNGELRAVSSFEPFPESGCAEMTDFATLPSFRGKRSAAVLLSNMEDEAAKAGIETAFTIARALSFGMNLTFARAGYTFGGTLYNNTNIGGSIESMNVWYKPLRCAP